MTRRKKGAHLPCSAALEPPTKEGTIRLAGFFVLLTGTLGEVNIVNAPRHQGCHSDLIHPPSDRVPSRLGPFR